MQISQKHDPLMVNIHSEGFMLRSFFPSSFFRFFCECVNFQTETDFLKTEQNITFSSTLFLYCINNYNILPYSFNKTKPWCQNRKEYNLFSRLGF